MGIYLNGTTAYTLYKSKTLMLEQLFPLVNEGNNYICITRPRRFGKTVTANMIAAFFSKAKNAEDIFDKCKISANPICTKYQNQYSVIHISFNDLRKIYWQDWKQINQRSPAGISRCRNLRGRGGMGCFKWNIRLWY